MPIATARPTTPSIITTKVPSRPASRVEPPANGWGFDFFKGLAPALACYTIWGRTCAAAKSSGRLGLVSEYPSRELEMLDQVAKDREALELRLSHMAYQDIADIQGVTVPTVRKRIRRAIQAGIPKETRDQARTLEVTRIDRLQRFNELVIQSAATTLAEKFTAQQAWLAASKVRAALLGLNMPAELEVKYSGALDHEIEALMVQMGGAPQVVDGEVVDADD